MTALIGAPRLNKESGIVMKSNKISYSTRFLLIPLILSLILTGILSLFTIRNLQGNARVINYTGIVRGATQRLVKQELNHQADDAMIEKIDVLLTELETGQGPDSLIRLNDEPFQNQILRMQDAWKQVKAAIYDFRAGASSDQLYALSETYFDLANDAVSFAEAYTEASVRRAQISLLLVNVFFLLITLALLYFSHIQHKRQKRLEQEEMETRRRQEELDQLNRELQAPMNEISELIYISDPETYDLLFINESGRKAFGCDSIEGKKCYKVLQGLDHPCPFCTNSRLKDNETYSWEINNALTHRHYLLKDRIVTWNGRRARLEIAFDTTKSEEEKQRLKTMLDNEKLIVDCVRELYEDEMLESAIPEMLRRLGEFMEAERITLFSLSPVRLTITSRWSGEKAADIEMLSDLKVRPFYARWMKRLLEDESYIVENVELLKTSFPDEYTLLRAYNIQQLIILSLEVRGEVIDCICIDNPASGKLQNSIIVLQTLRYFLLLARHRAMDKAKLAQLSYTDSLTGLFNRNRYIQDLDKKIADPQPVGVLFVDLNGLKEINDQFGHDRGDEALRTCSDHLRACFAPDSCYRIGGDEFVVLTHDITEEEFFGQVHHLRLRLQSNAKLHLAIGTHWAPDGSQLPSAIKAADEKMYKDKKAYYYHASQTGRYRHHTDEVLPLANLNVLRQKLNESRFLVYFQPKIAIDTGLLVGAEALVRYQLDENLILAPNAFIPLLEETQTISQIDFFVFEFVCLRLQKWIREGRPISPVSVNFSRYTVLEETFCQRLAELSDHYQISRDLLEIEITENALDVREEDLRKTIDAVRRSGFSVSIDDFGVEFSNLSLFSGADFDILKLDRSLIQDIAVNEKAQALIQAMSDVCLKMKIKLVAEGVETEEQLGILNQCHVGIAQGFLFSKPIPVADYETKYLPLPRS